MKRLLPLAVLVFVLGAAEEEERYAFSHQTHREVDTSVPFICADCHDATKTERGRPTLKTDHCLECHDEVLLVQPRAEPIGALSIPFEHKPHAKTDCRSCHASVVEPAEGKAEHRVTITSASCFSCHAETAGGPREQACITCHQQNQRREKPESHLSTAIWKSTHGRNVIPGAPSQHGQSCTLCHRESSCKTCHRVEKPADHSVIWGERTHGFAASFDRARCKTCHETGQCVGCHVTTQPRNHSGAWKATHGLVARTRSDTSCTTCHRPSFCVDCHRGGR